MKKPAIFNQKGFTLIEIISVLVILGILAAVAVPKYIDLQEEARLKAAQGAIAETKARLSMNYGKYLLANGSAGDYTTICDQTGSGLPTGCSGAVDVGSDFTVALANSGTTATITVSVVQGVTLGTAQTDTWELPQ